MSKIAFLGINMAVLPEMKNYFPRYIHEPRCFSTRSPGARVLLGKLEALSWILL